MIEKVDNLLRYLTLLKKEYIRDEDKKEYLKKKAKSLFLDVNKDSDLEDLKDDLLDDYVLRQILDIKSDEEYYSKMDKFLCSTF